MTLGKGLGGGVPIAALVASAGASCFEYGDQGGTFNGAPLMAAVGMRRARDRARPGIPRRRHRDRRLPRRAAARRSPRELGHGEVRGRGLLLALALRDTDAGKVVQAALDRGLLINAPRPDSLRFMPSLTVSRDEIDQMLDLLTTSLRHG